MSSAELTEWIAFNQLSPVGDDRGDLQAAIVSQVVANVNRAKGRKPYTSKDFMPYIIEDKTERPVSETFAAAAATIATVKRVKRNVSR
jgi:hypothetical protein